MFSGGLSLLCLNCQDLPDILHTEITLSAAFPKQNPDNYKY